MRTHSGSDRAGWCHSRREEFTQECESLWKSLEISITGIHPHDAKSWDEQSLDALRSLAASDECVAIGECGLDFNRNFSAPDVQLDVFERQVQLAVQLRKPLFLHERDAHDAFCAVLGRYQAQLPPVVVHCFTGSAEQLQRYVSLGFYIGLTGEHPSCLSPSRTMPAVKPRQPSSRGLRRTAGYIWKDKTDSGVRKCLEQRLIPLNRLLVETDCPFMFPNVRNQRLPQAVRDQLTAGSLSYLSRYCSFQRNEPCALPAIVELIAAFMRLPADELALKTSFNALKVFGLN